MEKPNFKEILSKAWKEKEQEGNYSVTYLGKKEVIEYLEQLKGRTLTEKERNELSDGIYELHPIRGLKYKGLI